MDERPCHFVRLPNGERCLIPGCWGSVDRNDLSHCYCHRPPRRTKAEILMEQIEQRAIDTQDHQIIDKVRKLRDLWPKKDER